MPRTILCFYSMGPQENEILPRNVNTNNAARTGYNLEVICRATTTRLPQTDLSLSNPSHFCIIYLYIILTVSFYILETSIRLID